MFGGATYRYPRWRGALALAGQDALLVTALVVLALLRPHEALSRALFAAVPMVLGFGVATLHHPARVELDDQGIAFARYGRVHWFSWREIRQIRVRRFLARDRILVRISPSTALRGRYWILSSIERFDELAAAIEARARARAPAPSAS
ncbi:MAG: hypothetical protein JOZ69_23620 [Myxococcales bacterium]|nr:hypothetical protein [Myxococcales bacterium]